MFAAGELRNNWERPEAKPSCLAMATQSLTRSTRLGTITKCSSARSLFPPKAVTTSARSATDAEGEVEAPAGVVKASPSIPLCFALPGRSRTGLK